MKLLCIDSNSILNRAFYGIKLLTTKDGHYTNAIFGYMNIFKKLLDEVRPDAVACAFDLPAPTFRHQMYDGYKAQRKGTPAELASQMPLVKELLEDLGYRLAAAEGYEADDILGTFAELCRRSGDECVIATGDRDSLQLVSDATTVLLASTKMGKPSTTVCTPAYIRETYGVEPAQLIDVKALMGDASDNIPGVKGIGEKGALALIREHGSLDAMYARLESLPVSPKLREKLENGRESAYLSRALAEICREVPLGLQIGECVPAKPDYPAAHALLSKLQMFSMITRLEIPEEAARAAPEPAREEGRERPRGARIAGDAETVRKLLEEEWSLDITGDFDGDDIVSFSVGTPGALYEFRAGSPDEIEQFHRILADPIPLRTDASKQLYRYAYRHAAPVQGVVFDAELAGYLLSPSSSGYSVGRLLGEYGMAVPEAGEFAAMGELCDRLEEEIRQHGLDKVLREIEIPLARVLASMELTGFQVDARGVAEFGRELDGQIALLEADVYTLAGGEFNLNSPKQLGSVLFERLELPGRRKTKSGYSTDAEALESLSGLHPVIPKILEYRKLAKLRSTYVEGLLRVVGEDGRIHTRFQQTETRTGRISSAEPNMQNIPVRTALGSTLRKFFVAREGCVLIDADYSQIELRVLAHIAQDENMLEAFATGGDIHTRTAAQVFGMPLEFVTNEMRARAKAVNFGIVYGIGAFSLSNDIGVSISEADQYIKSYLDTYRGVREYMERTVEKAREDGYVTTLYGRRRYLPELASANKNMQAFGRRVAMNTPIQGTAADIIKRAMIGVFDRLRREGLAARLILQVHDELIVEAPRGEAQRASEILREEMENAAQLSVKLKVDLNVGENWFDAK